MSKTQELTICQEYPQIGLEKLDQWDQSLKRIQKELERLEIARKVCLRWFDMIEANEALRTNSSHLFIDWTIHNYCVRLAMGIRRLVDKSSHTKNIFQLLEQIESCVCCVNVNCLIMRYYNTKIASTSNNSWRLPTQQELKDQYKKIIREVIGKTSSGLTPNDVKKDIKTIQDIAKQPIEKYVNNNFAHLGNPNKDIPTPTIDQAHECLDTLVSIYNKYSLLLGKGKLSVPQDKVIFAGWDKLFETPWKLSGQAT